jgi:hypothetical protein
MLSDLVLYNTYMQDSPIQFWPPNLEMLTRRSVSLKPLIFRYIHNYDINLVPPAAPRIRRLTCTYQNNPDPNLRSIIQIKNLINHLESLRKQDPSLEPLIR